MNENSRLLEAQRKLLDPNASQTVVEERVEVNQRHLIDKILARYSAEFTVFRELIQNSNDAGASNVVINFATDQDPKDRTGIIQTYYWKSKQAMSITCKNDGRPFSTEDWSRLKKIAEGNPDVDKIGFFGVGFYSLFSVCEEPFIQSAEDCMVFTWKGDALFTKRSHVPGLSEEEKNWTTFLMALREPMAIPDLESFGRFLATSLLFTSSLQSIRATVDDSTLLFEVRKKTSPSQPLDGLDLRLFNTESVRQFMKIHAVDMSQIQMDVRKAKEEEQRSFARTLFSVFLGSSSNSTDTSKPMEYETVNVFFRLIRATVKVKLPEKYAREMERTTKKRPPSTTTIQFIFSNFDEHQTNVQLANKFPIFKHLIPFPDQGRVFIGFGTHQTTGVPFHLAAHLIPTVERESIDFVDRTLLLWNQEVLTLSGKLARIVYENEMALLARGWTASPSQVSVDTSLHLLQCFHIKPSTPSPYVSELLRHTFFSCSANPISLPSTISILAADKIRLQDRLVSGFLKNVPMLLTECAQHPLVMELVQTGTIGPVTPEDVKHDIRGRTLTNDEIVSLLKWIIDTRMPPQAFSSVLDCCLITVDTKSKPMSLGSFEHFTHIRVIPPHMPVPPSTLPISITKSFSVQHLLYFRWKELSLIEWLRFAVSQNDFTTPAFVESVLEVVSRAFQGLGQEEKVMIVSFLVNTKCIPTTCGLKIPGEAYFKNINLFSDLPTISFSRNKIPISFLKDLGVRNHVDLQTVFDRLNPLNWDHYQLIKYLASVHLQLTDLELIKLRQTPIAPKEDVTQLDDSPPQKRYLINQLYVPNDSLRKLKLPVIQWPQHKWKEESEEARLLESLGLKSSVSLDTLLTIASDPDDAEVRHDALLYFIENYQTYAPTYRPESFKKGFVPCIGTSQLYSPCECFADAGCLVLNLPVIVQDWAPYADKFGVPKWPSSDIVINFLQRSPPDLKTAVSVFTFLSKIMTEFSKKDFQVLQKIPFIPVQRTKSGQLSISHLNPSRVYFKTDAANETYTDLFDYVDFEVGNAFLKGCGVREQPSPVELAEEILLDPERFYKSSSLERYLAILRRLSLYMSQNDNRVTKNLKDLMKKAKFLIAVRTATGSENKEHCLLRAKDIYVVDDSVLQETFNPWSAPMESLLEDFYTMLGSNTLSKAIMEEWIPRGNVRKSAMSESLQVSIRQRAPLLLYSEMRSNDDHAQNLDSLLKLEVAEVVGQIELSRSLGDVKRIQLTTSAVIKHSKEKQVPLLLVVKDYDYFDIAQVLNRVLLNRTKLNDSLLLSTLLATSLENLRRKGFPVDRLLTTTSQIQELSQSVVEPSSPPSLKKEMSENVQTDTKIVEELMSIFPNMKEEYLRSLVMQYNGEVAQICQHVLNNQTTSQDSSSFRDISMRGSTSSAGANTSFNEHEKSNSNNTLSQVNSLQNPFTVLKNIFGSTNSNFSKGNPRPHPTTSEHDISLSELQTQQRLLDHTLEEATAAVNKTETTRIFNSPTNLDYASNQAHCETIPSQDLRFIGSFRLSSASIRFYVHSSFSRADIASFWQNDQSPSFALASFGSQLLLLAKEVFHMNPDGIHIYYGPSHTIAFNRGNSLFFNLKIFIGLHLEEFERIVRTLNVDMNQFIQQPIATILMAKTSLSFWFVTYCHELAHNFEVAHNQVFAYYMGSFTRHYLPFYFALLSRSA